MRRHLDETDIQILNLLQANARLEVKQIARKVHKSASPVHERIRKLQDQGYIKRYMAVLDREKIGKPLLAVTQVTLAFHTKESLNGFEEAVKGMPQVLLCLSLSGPVDFILHVAASDASVYHAFLTNELCNLPGVEKVETYFVLKESKGEGGYPL